MLYVAILAFYAMATFSLIGMQQGDNNNGKDKRKFDHNEAVELRESKKCPLVQPLVSYKLL